MIAQAVLTTVSVDQGENSMLLLFKCDILDRSSPLWGSCWGLVSPFGSLRMSSQGNLFFFEKEGGRGGLGENCSLRSPFLVSTIWVLTHLAPKKLLFCAYPHSRFLKVLADQGSILESVFSVWMVDSKCFFFSIWHRTLCGPSGYESFPARFLASFLPVQILRHSHGCLEFLGFYIASFRYRLHSCVFSTGY